MARYGAGGAERDASAQCDRPTDKVAEGIDVTRAEFEFAVTHEGALNVDDILDRRTRIGLVAADRERRPPPRLPNFPLSRLKGGPTRGVSGPFSLLARERLQRDVLWRPRRAGAWPVPGSGETECAGSIFSSTTPISMAASTPPAIRSCSAANILAAPLVRTRCRGQLPLVQDADGRLRAHDRHLGVPATRKPLWRRVNGVHRCTRRRRSCASPE